MHTSWYTGNRWDGYPYGATQQQLLALLQAQTGQVEVWPRYKLLARVGLTAIPTGAFGPYGDDGDITDYVVSCPLSWDATQDVQGTATAIMREDAAFSFNAFQHALQVFCDYQGPGGVIIEEPVGIYVVPIGQRTIDDDAITDSFNMLDICTDLVLTFLNSWPIPKGTNIVTAARALLQCGYLPVSQGGTGATPSPASLDCAGPNVSSARILLPATDQVTAGPLGFTRKDTFLLAVKALMVALNNNAIQPDGMGNLKAPAKIDLSQGPPTPVRTWQSGSAGVLELPITEQGMNAANFANIVSLLVTNGSQAPFGATVYNRSLLSALSLDNLGRAIPKVIDDSTIPSAAYANAYAHLLLQDADGLADQVSISIPPDPWIEMHDAVQLTVNDPQGNPTISSAAGWEVVGGTMDLDNQRHTLTVQRYQQL